MHAAKLGHADGPVNAGHPVRHQEEEETHHLQTGATRESDTQPRETWATIERDRGNTTWSDGRTLLHPFGMRPSAGAINLERRA